MEIKFLLGFLLTKESHTLHCKTPAPALPIASQKLIEQLIAEYQTLADIIGENGLLKQITKAVFEAALKVELAAHLRHDRHGSAINSAGNVRYAESVKTITADFGKVDISVPRDRQASFGLTVVPKHQRRFPGIDERILSLCARSMNTREIVAHLEQIFVAEVSPSLISTITDTIANEIKARQAGPLEALYPILYLDCLMVKTCESGAVANRAIYMPICVNLDGQNEVLGLWSAATEGAKFLLSPKGTSFVTKAFQNPLKPYSRSLRCSSKSCIWYAIA